MGYIGRIDEELNRLFVFDLWFRLSIMLPLVERSVEWKTREPYYLTDMSSVLTCRISHLDLL